MFGYGQVMFDYGQVLWPHVLNNLTYGAYYEGFDITVLYFEKTIVVGPGKIYTKNKVYNISKNLFLFTPGYKWGVIYFDPFLESLSYAEGAEEEPVCFSPFDKMTCIRPRPPVVEGITIALVPLWQ